MNIEDRPWVVEFSKTFHKPAEGHRSEQMRSQGAYREEVQAVKFDEFDNTNLS